VTNRHSSGMEYVRQYSMCGNPADNSLYQIAVLREDDGRGGSLLMHRIFTEGRRLFIAKPLNHFQLNETAPKSYLMGGGIGITPLIAMAHRLHDINADFVMHYSGREKQQMAFLEELASFPWADKVQLHVSGEGTRIEFASVFAHALADSHVYTCGSENYMNAVMDAAEQAGFSDEQRHLEYFSVPETPEWVNHEFSLKLARSGKVLEVPAELSATDVLVANGIDIDVKCSDGLCGVCQCGLIEGDAEHRDFVLSKSQQQDNIILCQSRAAEKGGVLVIDL